MILFELLSPSKSATLASRKAHPAAAADLSSAVHLFLSPCLREGKKGGRGEGKDKSPQNEIFLRETTRNNVDLTGSSGRRRAPCTKSWRSAAFPA